ncbi:MAG: hypothetical protein IJ498_03835 [Akkermansia sp.]|nr:hypothetical protein [Akkermansia sp.]
MPDDDFLILPGVRGTVGKLAALARTGLMLCAILSIAEVVFLSGGYLLMGVLSGVLSSVILNLELFVLSLLVLWCHDVLLLERGYGFTRFLGYLAAFFSVICPVCTLYTTFTEKQLLLNQALLPFIVCLLFLLIFFVNLPNMEAATRILKIRLGIFPILTMCIFVFDQPGALLFAGIGKLLLLMIMAHPLRQLADIAPRVISMPPTEEPVDDEQRRSDG